MQAGPPGDHDGHDDAADRRSDGHRVPVALQPVVAADDQDRRVRARGLQAGGAAGLDVEVALARPPRRQRGLERGSRIGDRGRPGRRARRRTARAAARPGRRWRRHPNAGMAVGGQARRRTRSANRSAAATNAPESCQGTITSSANPCAAGSYSSRIRSASTLVVIMAALPDVNTAQTRSTAAVRSTGGATPPQAHATAAGPVSTSPAARAGSPPPASQRRMRSAADCARAMLRRVGPGTVWSRTVRSPAVHRAGASEPRRGCAGCCWKLFCCAERCCVI